MASWNDFEGAAPELAARVRDRLDAHTHKTIATLRREATGGKWDPEMVERFAAMLGATPPVWEQILQPAPMLKLA